MIMQRIRSPLFYTGDKYKIINNLKKYFPKKIRKFIEPFVGGGSVLLNVEADSYFENDIDSNIIQIHKYLSSYKTPDELINLLLTKIQNYGFSCSYLDNGNSVPKELKDKYVKTYYARFNINAYNTLKKKYNNSDKSDIGDLYLLLVYGFNHMLRFNKAHSFNLPVGNVDFNHNTYEALCNYVNILNDRNVKWSNEDFSEFLLKINLDSNDFIYLDPPYLITSSEYNKIWSQEDDNRLFKLMDSFNKKNISFAMSNVVRYKGKENKNLIKWANNYKVVPIKSNYINYHDNSIKSFEEVLITNYA